MTPIDAAGNGAPAPNGTTTLKVGEWTVEPALNQLSAGDATVKLEPKAMAVLVYLADRAGQVVTRENLLSGVWADVVVGDDSVTQVVMKLRKALGNGSGYIQTISKGGYRLVAPVVRVPRDAVPPVAPGAGAGDANRKRRVPWMTAGGVAALFFAGIGAWLFHDERAIGKVPDRIFASVAVRAAQPTVAVKPFEVLGDDPQAVLLARGMTADLVTDLSKVSGLSVVDFPASGNEKSTQASPIRYLVTGSVQRFDERLRLRVHLTDTETGKRVWSERFDRAPNEFFAFQEELGPKILQVLPAKVSEAELRRVAHRDTRNLEAYQHFQRGQTALRARQKPENEVAREMFRRAIALDANFARAYSGLARTYAAEHRNQWTDDSAAVLGRALELAKSAHQMNPDIPETYWVLAYVHLQRRQHDEALRHLETAVRRSPSYADGYALMAAVYTDIGRPADAVSLVRAAMHLSPEPGNLYYLTLGRSYLFLGDLEQARINLEHALSRNPTHLEARVYMAALHMAGGDKAAAAWEAEEIRALHPAFSSRRWMETNHMADAAQRTKVAQALQGLGL